MVLTARYEWEETAEEVTLRIPLKGTKPSDVGVFCSDLLVRLSFSPYVLVLDLLHEVDESKSRAISKGGTLVLQLPKIVHGLWGELCVSGCSKAELKERRKLSEDRRREREQSLAAERKSRKIADERYAVRQQMSVDDAERQDVENLKAKEKEEAEREVYSKFAQLREAEEAKRGPSSGTARPLVGGDGGGAVATAAGAAAAGAGLASVALTSAPAAASVPAPSAPAAAASSAAAATIAATATTTNAPATATTATATTTKPANIEEKTEKMAKLKVKENAADEDDDDDDDDDDDIFTEDDIEDAQAAPATATSATKQAEEEEDLVYIPDPREATTIKFAHTERIFPTPMRESKQREEDDWIARNWNYLPKSKKGHKMAFGKEFKDISQRDPAWLKGKGDDFFRSGDFRGAINAYAACIEAADSGARMLSSSQVRVSAIRFVSVLEILGLCVSVRACVSLTSHPTSNLSDLNLRCFTLPDATAATGQRATLNLDSGTSASKTATT